MIPNQWYAILESNEVKKGRPIGTTRMGEKLVAWRDSQGRITVMADKCPHRGVADRRLRSMPLPRFRIRYIWQLHAGSSQWKECRTSKSIARQNLPNARRARFHLHLVG
jgi:hypothetical protein